MFMVTTKGECVSILKSAQAIPITHTSSDLYPSKRERPINLEWINKKTQIKISVKMLNDVHGIFNAKFINLLLFIFGSYCVFLVPIALCISNGVKRQESAMTPFWWDRMTFIMAH